MENLQIKHRVNKVLRKFLGVLFIISGLVWLIAHIREMKFFDWFYTIVYTGIGVVQFTSAFAFDLSEIIIENDFIRIRWLNWFKPRIVYYSEIDKLTLTMFDIQISRKGKKTLKLPLDFMEISQMREVREFFLKLSAEKGISHENKYHKAN